MSPAPRRVVEVQKSSVISVLSPCLGPFVGGTGLSELVNP